jgi:hypothetical protein
MRAIRQLCFLFSSVALVLAIGCSHPETQNMQAFLDRISHSPDSELPKLLYGYSQSSPAAQQVLLRMLQPLRAPSAEQQMSVEAVQRSGRFTMIVARVPWSRGPKPLLPVIITGDPGNEQVIGYVMPFDDIMPLLRSDMESITDLSHWWISQFGQGGGV